jgi:phenylpropionate dioxygenase-like ring-hydroxylating dioxygenase large terminal subunit
MAAALDALKGVPLVRVETTPPGGTPAGKYADPDLGTKIIPKERYVGAEFMKLEWERMWTRTWQIGGRHEVIPEPGDWMSHEIGTESLIFVRQADMSIKGFFNVCPHRGNRIVEKDASGSAAAFKCGYHHWEWTTDGALHNLPDRETFPQLAGCTTLGLKPVSTGEWGGFFFFNLDPDAEPLMDYLGEIPAHLAPYEFENQKLIDWKTIEWDCNWKTSVDAFNEAYHVPAIHPELLSWLDNWNVQIDCLGIHNRYLVPFTTPSPHYHEQSKLSGEMLFFASLAGVDPADYEGRPRDLRLAIQRAKRARQDDTIYPYRRMNDDQLSDDYHYMIFPNATMNVYGEAMLLFVSRPHPTDPNKMLFDLMNFAHLPPDQPWQLPEHQTYKHGQISLGLVLDQDAYNLPRVQEGMNSRAYEGLIIGTQELRIRHFHKILDDYIDGVRPDHA